MEPQKRGSAEQPTERIIHSGKRLTIETTGEFVQQLRQGLSEVETVVINFDPDVEMDLTALQVICAACKTANAEGKQFNLNRPLPQALLDLAATAGAESLQGCTIQNKSCICQFGGIE